jgi:general secretion pathway protein J
MDTDLTTPRKRSSWSQLSAAGTTRNGGFTLLELLIAITLLGLLMAAAYSGFRTGTRAWTTGEKRAENNEQMRIVETFLRRQISQTYPLTWTAHAKRTVWFRGQTQALDFASVIASRALDNGLAFLRLEIVEGKKGLALVLSCRMANAESVIKAFEVKGHDDCQPVRMLADHLESGEFAYFGKPSGPNNVDQKEPHWYSAWSSRQTLPRAVRVKLRARPGGITWPPLLIPIHTEVVAGEEQQILHLPREGGGVGGDDSSDTDEDMPPDGGNPDED